MSEPLRLLSIGAGAIGTYIGGSLNFAAVAEASGMQDGSSLAAAIAADNVATNLHFLLELYLSPCYRNNPVRESDTRLSLAIYPGFLLLIVYFLRTFEYHTRTGHIKSPENHEMVHSRAT